MTDSAPQANDPAALNFLAAPGEMSRRMRAFDWSTTPVGPAAAWPQSLKTAVSICLGSRYPIVIWWGRDELTQLYNDGYAQILGAAKHPRALGISGRDCWSEIWHIVGPMFDGVFATGVATWSEDFLYVLDRKLPQEETYFTFSYSPLLGDDGAIGGIFCACAETTGRVIGERRLRTLRDLGRTVMEAQVADAACEAAARTLAANPHDLPFTLLYLLDASGEHAELVGATGVERGAAASPLRIELTDARAAWPLRSVVETRRAVEVDDLERFDALPGGAWPESPRRAVVLPMAKSGQGELAGFVVVGLSPRLLYDDDYRGFAELLAGHVATAVANARAYEEERKRALALAELDRVKTAFFSNVSHEFRTPLTLMLGPVDDLLDARAAELAPPVRESMEVVRRNGLRLLRLVNTLLDFSRIEAGRARACFEPTDLGAYTAELASSFRAACERAGLRLDVDCAAGIEPVYVDRAMWEKVVLNLLSNAFKFTFDGAIAVRVRANERGVELRVEDTGTGIPRDELSRVFERFHRVEDARGRTHEGSGIGLALVHELVQLHGGAIVVHSELDAGTTFVVELQRGRAHLPPEQVSESRGAAARSAGAAPFVEEALRWLPDVAFPDAAFRDDALRDDAFAVDARRDEESQRQLRSDLRASHARDERAAAHAALSPDRERADARSRVFVVDDNADMRGYVARLLREHYSVDAFADGATALAAIRERAPDLVLTDVMMPKLDGFALLRELRAEPSTATLPVILLSARAGEECRVDGLEAGADDYLVKPFGAKELFASVASHLRMARVRREANEALRLGEERLRTALVAARMIAWRFDPSSDELELSHNAAEVLGLPRGATLTKGAQWFALMHTDDVAEHRAAMRKVIEHDASYVRQFRMIRPDTRETIWLEERGHALDDGVARRRVLVGAVLDITERKHAEEALRETDRRKDEFLALLAHELRNPLAPISNAAQVLRLAGSDPKAVQSAAELLKRQVGQMSRMVEDLLDVSRISRGKIELRKSRVELAPAIKHAAEAARSMLVDMRHELALDLPAQPIHVHADPTRFAQIVGNLLSNACKFTPRGGHIRVALERVGDRAVVRVRDDGIGIDPAQRARIFEMFVQLDTSLERASSGLGIGLTLVKELVEMHDGSIEVHSAGARQGSEFVVRLPALAEAATKRAAPTITDAPPSAARRVLVVDDNQDSAISLSILLKLMGHATQVAHDGQHALVAANAFRPQMMLLDIGMPKLNGYEVARWIRAQTWGKAIVLVAMTGWGQDEDRRRSAEAGFDAHLVKPVQVDDVKRLLDEIGARAEALELDEAAS